MSDAICRFAVGTPTGARSSSYVVWAAKRSADVFIASRPMSGLIKASLHSARPDRGLEAQSHHGLTKEYADKLRTIGRFTRGSRLFTIWHGREVAPGVTQQFVLFIPGYGLRSFENPTERVKEIQWIPVPPDHHSVMVSVYVGPAELNLPPSGLLGHATLCDGRTVVVMQRSVPRSNAEFDPRTLRTAPPELYRFTPAELRLPTTRAVLFGQTGPIGAWTEVAGDVILAGMQGHLR